MTGRSGPSSAHPSAREAAVAVVTRLRDAGHTAYLAGGCVRDELLGVEPKDYDVATDARPDAIRGLFARTAEVGASFGVMLVRELGATIEVATFRSDGPYSDRRRPDHVEFADARADAQRRDFTINALFIDPLVEGETGGRPRIIDHVGGLADVEARVLRAVGDPGARLAEDHLRALRAVRFAARYGLTIEARTAAAIREHAAELRGVSVERVGEEVRRMMGDPSRARAAELIAALGVDGPIFGEHRETMPAALGRLRADADVALALAAWATDRAGRIPDARETAGAWRGALDLSNDLADDLRRTLGAADAFVRAWGTLGVAARKRLLAGPRSAEALALVGAVDADRRSSIEHDRDGLAGDGVGLAPGPLIDGDLLVARGFRPGPGFGDLLDRVYDAQLEGRVASRDAALRLADELAEAHGVNRSDA